MTKQIVPQVPDDHENTHEVLFQAIREADLLIAYASENGIELAEEVVETLVGSKQLLHEQDFGGDATYAAQTKFWTAYKAVAKAVRPVSSSSIEATMARRGRQGVWAIVADRLWGPKMTTQAQRSIFWFSLTSFAVLVTLLVSQVYWVIGTRLDVQSTQLIAQAEELSKQKSLQQKNKIPDDAPEMLQLEATGEQLNLELGIRVEALRRWNHIWKSLLAIFPIGSSALKGTGEEADNESPFTSLRKAKLEASLAKECIELYLLPLLYGLLGACLHVLRTLAAEIKAKTYAADRLYGIRIYTGGLAGLVIAWFGIAGDSGTPLASLTPFALALLAGYSVELLFAFMDRLVGAFTGKHEGT